MNNRAELKSAYKQMAKDMGVYQIKNNLNGKVFIGSSLDIQARINRHKFELDYGLAPGPNISADLQKEWKEYSEKNFSFTVLDTLKPSKDDEKDNPKSYKQELEILEEMWLEKLQPYAEQGYNKKRIKK